MTDVVQPYIHWRKPLLHTGVYSKGDGLVEFAWDIGGAFHVDETALYSLKIADLTEPSTGKSACPSLSSVNDARILSQGKKYPVATNKETFWSSRCSSACNCPWSG